MFISLNKKILYTISIFFILTFILFVLTFFVVYGQKFVEEQHSNTISTLRILEMNQENVILRQELNNIQKEHPKISISPTTKKILSDIPEIPTEIKLLSSEQRRISAPLQTYETRYNSLDSAIKIIISSILVISVLIIFLGVLLKKWLLQPINYLAEISDRVSEGDLSTRISTPKTPFFTDELSKLNTTFNQMLENLNHSFNEIKSKESFLQSLIDSIPDGIRVIDEDYNIVIANQTYCRQTAQILSPQEKCYFSSQQLSHPCSKDKMLCPLEEIKKRALPHLKVIQKFKNTPETHFSINAAPMKITHSDGSEQTYIVESIRDLSADIEFSHQQKLSSLGFLASSVAHEMKNHLGAIRMISEALLQKYSTHKLCPEDEQKYLHLIHKQICECIEVPERLLRLSREHNDYDGKINCNISIQEVAALLDYEAKRRGSSIDIQIPTTIAYLRGNATDFKMMLINLAQNALNAMPENGLLIIKLSQSSQYLSLRFIDNGCGIAPSALPRIFEPFYTTNTDKSNPGTGLGLSIVKSIVEKLKGQIEIKSRLGKGTEIILKFASSIKKAD